MHPDNLSATQFTAEHRALVRSKQPKELPTHMSAHEIIASQEIGWGEALDSEKAHSERNGGNNSRLWARKGLEALVDGTEGSVREKGVQNAVHLWNGSMMDGRHRVIAQHRIDPQGMIPVVHGDQRGKSTSPETPGLPSHAPTKPAK